MHSQTPAQHDELEQALTELGSELEYPTVRDLVPAVRARILANSTSPRPRWSLHAVQRRAVLFAPLAVVIVLAVIVSASPGARSAVADRLGLPGISISTDPTATVLLPDDGALQLGTPVTLEAAIERVDYPIVLPPTELLGEPDAIYLLERHGGAQVSYVYDADSGLPSMGDSGIGVLVSQVEGTTNSSFIEKQLSEGTMLDLVLVGGQRAFWLSGEPHVFFYADPEGDIWEESIRLAANVLIWQHDGKTLRIESALPQEQAIRIAESMKATR